MSDANKRNLVYFESSSMRTLYNDMERWQQTNHRRLLSISIQKDQDSYCCIALTNPTEVVITSADGKTHAEVLPAFKPDPSSAVAGVRLQSYPARLAVSG
jgi:hypothetical protein